jgi:hypothetical protein
MNPLLPSSVCKSRQSRHEPEIGILHLMDQSTPSFLMDPEFSVG